MGLKEDLLAQVDVIVAASDALSTAQDASHQALQDLADTTSQENAKVIAAQAEATQQISEAQSKADAAVKITDDDKATLDEALEKLKAIAEGAKV